MNARLSLMAAAVTLSMAAVNPQGVSAQGVDERILVMPFENVTRDAKIFWLSEAAAVLLTDDLNAMGARAITREERHEAFDRLQVPPAAALSDATVMRLGQLVGAAAVVVGTLRLDNDALIIEARQIAIDTARVRYSVNERGPLSELFANFERVARQLVPTTSRTVEEVERQHPPAAAFESYIKGLLAESPKTAIGYLRAALESQPNFDRARLALWAAYSEQGDHQLAANSLTAIEAASPMRTRAQFLLGMSQLALGRNDDAFDTYKALSDTHPTAAVFNNLGVVQIRRGGTPQSGLPTFYFDKATTLDPTDPDLFFNLGYAYWAARDAGATVYWLREAVRRNAADGEAHYVLGAALSSAGNAAEASREKELARRLSSTFAEWDKRPTSDAVPKGLERLKDDVALPAAKQPDMAQNGQRDQQELATFYAERGRRLYEEDNDRGAIDELNRALFLSPYHAEANLWLGRVHLRGGRVQDAIGALKISVWSAESAAAHAALASAYVEAKDLEGARAEATRALALDAESSEAKQVLDRVRQTDR
jgi:tetratricopeptide (TPR) repeat protein